MVSPSEIARRLPLDVVGEGEQCKHIFNQLSNRRGVQFALKSGKDRSDVSQMYSVRTDIVRVGGLQD